MLKNDTGTDAYMLRTEFDRLYNLYGETYNMQITQNRIKFLQTIVMTYIKAIKNTARITPDNSFFDMSVHEKIIGIFTDWELENYLNIVKGECSLHGKIEMSELQNFIENG